MIYLVLGFIVVLASGTILFRKINQTPIHGDESGWIYSGYYYTDLVLKNDLARQRWVCDFCGSFGDFNMHLGKWLLGIPIQIELQKPSSLSDFQNWEKALREKDKIRATDVKEPPPSILLSARRSSVVFGVLCCVILLSIGHFCNNIWIGFISALILSFDDLFIASSTRAMADVSYNLFLISLCLCAFPFLKYRSRKALILSTLLFGVISGFATSVKIMGLTIGILFFLSLCFYKSFFHAIRKTEFVSYLMIFGLASTVVIYVLNPVFWPSFRQMDASAIIRESVAITKNFNGIYRDTRAITASPSGKNVKEFVEAYSDQYPQLFNLSHVFIFPGLFFKWNFEMNQRARAEDTWEGKRFMVFHRNLLVTYASFPFEWIFLAIGIASISRRIYFSLRTGEPTFWIIPLAYFIVNYGFIIALMKVNWDRYYLPTVIATQMVVGVGLFETARTATEQIVRWAGALRKASFADGA
jgi:hypothetical protein